MIETKNLKESFYDTNNLCNIGYVCIEIGEQHTSIAIAYGL